MIYRNNAASLIAGLVMVWWTVSCPAQLANEDPEKQVEAVFSTADTAGTPGAAVLVVQDGKVLLNRGYGLAQLEHRIPVTPTTVFDIASVSKQFCGMAIAMLIDQGKIAYRDDVRKFIPELPDFGHTITIAHLLHHTSGIRDWTSTLALAGWSFDDVISFEQILNMAYHQQALNFVPGSQYTYSNTGYNLLAEVIQRVSGQSFRQWTRQNIFQPLGMKNTHFQDDYTEVIPNRAYGYYKDENGQYHHSVNSLTALGSSSLFTTTEDLAKWMMNFDDPKVGGPAVVQQMMQCGVLNSGEQISYAFGLDLSEYKGLQRVSHGGSWASFRSYFLYFPEQRFSVVVLLNHSGANSYRLAHQVADIYLGDELKPESATVVAEKGASEPFSIAPAELDDYTGTYRLGPAWYVTITREDDRLITTATGEPSFPMTPTSDSTFTVEDYGGRSINFKRDKAGVVTHFVYDGMICPQVEKTAPARLGDYTGTFQSRELNTVYTIRLESDQLAAHHRHHGRISLTPLFGDEFLGGQWFMRAVEFTRDREGKVTGFKVTQYRSRNQEFLKM